MNKIKCPIFCVCVSSADFYTCTPFIWYFSKILSGMGTVIEWLSGDVISVIYRVRTCSGNPGKSLNFKNLFSRPGKSWNCEAGPGKS